MAQNLQEWQVIQFEKSPGMKVLELGGGDHPTNLTDVNIDCRPGDKVHIVIDFEQTPWPLQDEEWDAIFCVFCLEHISWRKTPEFLGEVWRILKPSGRIFFVLPNTEAQLKYIQSHPDGWEDRSCFKSASITLYGDQDYLSNGHKAYFSPSVATQLFSEAGFESILTSPYGAISTDMVLEAVKPIILRQQDPVPLATTTPEFPTYTGPNTSCLSSEERAALFDNQYFDCGTGRVGGYSSPGYRDFPSHEIVARRILERKPESVLELGAARGYILKRIQDSGVRGRGIDISKHCILTRACDGIGHWDICLTPWSLEQNARDPSYDLLYSINVLQHLPEEFLPNVLREMARVSRRGLHAIDFNLRETQDKTRCTLRPDSWWVNLFNTIVPDYPVELCSSQSLEQGQLPKEVLEGDGFLKIALGTFTTLARYGWENSDIHDLSGWAQSQGYRFRRIDVREGLPYGTGTVDLIHQSHLLEHLPPDQGLAFLRECRRVIRRDGLMRVIVPDAKLLMDWYRGDALGEFDQLNKGCADSPTSAGKLWALLHEGHAACYDTETLAYALSQAGFIPYQTSFRQTTQGEKGRKILRECEDMLADLSLVFEATPLLG